MNQHTVIIYLCLLVLTLAEPSVSRGTFEVHLSQINFTRWAGPLSCCPSPTSTPLACARSCSVHARVCLTVYDRTFTSGRCHFGNFTVQLSPAPPGREPLARVDRDFRFHILPRWNHYFTLVFDVFGGAREMTLNADSRLVRHVESKTITPSKDWYTFMRDQSGVTLHYSYRFQCEANYYGKDCGQRCEPRNGTHGHYDCSPTGKPVCHPGWSGPFCNIAKCAKDCHMICETPGVKCRCEDGWEGPQCNRCKKADKCVNGACKVDSRGNKFPGTCECFSGWGGQNCEKDLHYCANHPGVCKNGGTCFNQEDPENGAQQFRCRCKEGFAGPTCETEIAKSCLVNRCSGRGRCMRDTTTARYVCVCVAAYFGSMCELNATECAAKRCPVAGTHCVWDVHDTTVRCACPAGKRCGGKMDYCASRPCENGGTCVALENGYRCSCPRGLSGNRCQFNLSACSLTCRHGGRCRHTATRLFCDCPLGYTGATCECPPCHNGYCVRAPGPEVGGAPEYRCICRNGFYGAACNRSVPTRSAWPTTLPEPAAIVPGPTSFILVALVCTLSLIALTVFLLCCRRAYRRRRRASQANDYIKNNRPSTIQNDLHTPMSHRPESPMPSATVHPQTAALSEVKKPLDDSLELPPPKVHNIADQSVNLLPPSPPPQPPAANGTLVGNSKSLAVVGMPRETARPPVWALPHGVSGAKDTAVFLASPERRRQGINWFSGSTGGHATQV